ncbi:hypothetical protein EDEG_03125 [Edhazardia aedis USNM 41457]|uniref:Uncharacterized protein n=1 Tax=Edhazardia aedis (strain USNM 41457) TaxID=1003232 RepID=J9DM43_EDHAE|nr:hypothetical protein EDEG_03125 [Edhazardia aedis USNM 41457]|eukprot:EJW02452.1 hypothetical protein EDEG_03125 [Edhazardia aedis USNM 41457]
MKTFYLFSLLVAFILVFSVAHSAKNILKGMIKTSGFVNSNENKNISSSVDENPLNRYNKTEEYIIVSPINTNNKKTSHPDKKNKHFKINKIYRNLSNYKNSLTQNNKKRIEEASLLSKKMKINRKTFKPSENRTRRLLKYLIRNLYNLRHIKRFKRTTNSDLCSFSEENPLDCTKRWDMMNFNQVKRKKFWKINKKIKIQDGRQKLLKSLI